MWLSEHDSLKHQIKRLERELKTLRKERQRAEAKGCYSDRELAAKEAALEDYDRRIQMLEIGRDRLQFMHQTGGSRDVAAES
jgi:predicted  nucleic acid-binding Zn-ribbon protein